MWKNIKISKFPKTFGWYCTVKVIKKVFWLVSLHIIKKVNVAKVILLIIVYEHMLQKKCNSLSFLVLLNIFEVRIMKQKICIKQFYTMLHVFVIWFATINCSTHTKHKPQINSTI